MLIEEYEDKMDKMQQKYGANTRKYLEGNMHADQQLNKPLTVDLYSKITFKTTTLPRFIIQNDQTGDYTTNAIKVANFLLPVDISQMVDIDQDGRQST